MMRYATYPMGSRGANQPMARHRFMDGVAGSAGACATRRSTRPSSLRAAAIGCSLALTAAPACTPCRVFGPLQQQRDERELILHRAQGSSVSVEVLNVVAPPLTPEEVQAVQSQNESCRSSYMWKSALGWTGELMVAVAAGVTIGGAYVTGSSDSTTGKIAFGISAGSVAALGGIIDVAANLIALSFVERGCVVK